MSVIIPIAKTQGLRQASLIYIHGLGGHPYETWRARGKDESGQPMFWPVWLAEDLPGVDVYSIGYDASASGWTGQTMAIEDRAENICELLLREEGLSKAPVYFLCHSLGGIILKRLMLRLKERTPHEPDAAALYTSIQKIGFLATPHTGSDKAGLMDRFRLLVWPTALTRALVSNASTLRQVNTSYRLLAREREEDLLHKVLFETRSTALGQIVREGPADPGLVNTNAIGVDGDHITIVKPKSREALTYKCVLEFLSENLVGHEKTPPLILQRLPYDSTSQIDVLGLLARVSTLAALFSLVWFLWPQLGKQTPDRDPDVVQIVYAVAAIENATDRVVVAERLLDRSLSEKERILVENLKLTAEAAKKVDTTLINRLAESGNSESLRTVVAQIDVSTCKDGAGLEIAQNRLRCFGGDFVPFVATPNQSGPIQSLEAIVFHYTASNNASAIVSYFSDNRARASTHILIDRSGGIVQMVAFDTIAWHAGRSSYTPLGLDGLNRYSVGVSLVNLGKLIKQTDGSFRGIMGQKVESKQVIEVSEDNKVTYWHKYTEEQIATATAIAKAFHAGYPDIVFLGHRDIAPGRKLDPGPAFPLNQIVQATR